VGQLFDELVLEIKALRPRPAFCTQRPLALLDAFVTSNEPARLAGPLVALVIANEPAVPFPVTCPRTAAPVPLVVPTSAFAELDALLIRNVPVAALPVCVSLNAAPGPLNVWLTGREIAWTPGFESADCASDAIEARAGVGAPPRRTGALEVGIGLSQVSVTAAAKSASTEWRSAVAEKLRGRWARGADMRPS